MPAAKVDGASQADAQRRGRGAHATFPQRQRILEATVEVVAEAGLGATSLARVTERARVSRLTFLARFAGIEHALSSVIDDTLADVTTIVERAFAPARPPHDCLRDCVAQVLLYFDRKPDLARVLLVETLTANPDLLAHRQAAVNRFGALVGERFTEGAYEPDRLAAEAALAAAMGMVYSRLIDPERAPLIELIGPLMGVLAVASSTEVDTRGELRRGSELTRALEPLARSTPTRELDYPGIVPRPLRDPRSFRARDCLIYVAANPGSSNRQIGEAVGIRHRGQLSALLASLCRLGVVSKESGAPGHANSWSATTFGLQVARVLGE